MPAELSGPQWTVLRARGDAAALHADVPLDARTLRWGDLEAAALVLGSTQPAVSVPFVRRRSGGGAVWARPGDLVWADIVVPRGDLLWDDDVGRAFMWLGQTWAGALSALGISGVAVHAGAMTCAAAGSKVCFAGRGPGEVLVDGRKVVGISQRRTRDGARFQCAALLRWEPEPLADAIGVPLDSIASVGVGLRELDPAITASAVEEAFVAALAR